MNNYSYGGYPPPVLPGMEEYILQDFTTPTDIEALPFRTKSVKSDPFFLHMCECCKFTSQWQMPIIEPVSDSSILEREIMGYDRIANAKSHNYGTHFYCSDPKILASLRNPRQVYQRIKSQPFVIGPDYSVRMNMPFPQKLNNSFNIKLITAWYQYMGVLTVPNVVWSDESHIDAYLDGYPSCSIIAINSTGIGHDARAIMNWQTGYRYVVEVLNPLAIIRYGVKLPGEVESISYYKKNDNLKSCCYGW